MTKHTCTVCGREGEWSDSWSWYGVVKVCSEECKGTAQGNPQRLLDERSFFKTRASPARVLLTIAPDMAGAIIDEYGELTLDTLASFLVKKRNLRD